MKVAKVAALAMSAAVKVLRASLFGLAAATGLAIFKMTALGESINQAMQQSLAIMGNVSDKMRTRMERMAVDVARTTTASAKQAAESYFILESAGLNAAKSLAALPTVAKFAHEGMFDMA